jgi:hypothetical protein
MHHTTLDLFSLSLSLLFSVSLALTHHHHWLALTHHYHCRRKSPVEENGLASSHHISRKFNRRKRHQQHMENSMCNFFFPQNNHM